MSTWNPSVEEMDAAGICMSDFDTDHLYEVDEFEAAIEEGATISEMIDTYGIAILSETSPLPIRSYVELHKVCVDCLCKDIPF